MGRHHVRILGVMPDVELVAVVDPDTQRALPHATAAGTTVVSTLDQLPAVDIAVIATPTDAHVEIASELMSLGTHVLVEKPLAGTLEDAEKLVALAAAHSVVLAVGHVERFNAAVNLVGRLVTEPLLVSFERLSPYTPRIKESVVFDLMVHDLDLACWLAGGYPTSIAAAGRAVFSDTFDVCSAVLGFESGCVITLQSSRATQDKVRRICVSEKDRFIVADSVRQDVSIKREVEVEFSDEGGAGAYRQANVVEVPYLDRSGEPLARELRDFVDAVREKRAPLVTGEAGLNAVRLAYAVERAAGSGGAETRAAVPDRVS
jgi:UDP-N-acetylglucosamine 3-dehydrogenase